MPSSCGYIGRCIYNTDHSFSALCAEAARLGMHGPSERKGFHPGPNSGSLLIKSRKSRMEDGVLYM